MGVCLSLMCIIYLGPIERNTANADAAVVNGPAQPEKCSPHHHSHHQATPGSNPPPDHDHLTRLNVRCDWLL